MSDCGETGPRRRLRPQGRDAGIDEAYGMALGRRSSLLHRLTMPKADQRGKQPERRSGPCRAPWRSAPPHYLVARAAARSARPVRVSSSAAGPSGLGLRAAHEEAFLDDLTIPDCVQPDLIKVHTFLALGRDL